MECLYKNSIIDLYGDETIIEYLREESVEDIFEELYLNLFEEKDRKSTKSLYAFENFVIKYYDSLDDEIIKTKCDSIIDKLYTCLSISNISNTAILSNASNLFKSTLTRTANLNKFADENKQKEVLATKKVLYTYAMKYAEKFNIYFNKQTELIKNGINTYNNKELKSLELTDDEKKILLSFFSIQKTNTPDSLEWVNDIQEKYFLSLVADPISNTNNINEKEFLVTYAIKHFYSKNYNVDPEYSFEYIADKEGLGGVARGTDFITINFSSILNMSNLNLVETACHEAEHIAQSKIDYKKDLNNSLAYQYMIRLICGIYPQKYNISDNPEKDLETNENYRYMEIELDAEKIGIFKLKSYISDYLFRKYNLDTSSIDHRIDVLNQELRERLSPMLANKKLNNESVPVFHYNMVRMKEIISNHTDLIKKFPVLELLYDVDGNIKSVSEIFSGKPLKNQMYLDFMLEAVYNDEIKTIDINNLSTDEQRNYMENLSNCLDYELDKISDFVSNPIYFRKDNTYLLFKANIIELNKLIEQIENNINILEKGEMNLEVQTKLNRVIELMNQNKEKINNMLIHPQIPDIYINSYNKIKNKLCILNRKLEINTYNLMCNRRKNYVLNNSLKEKNEFIIKNIQDSINFDDDFYNYVIQDNLGTDVTLQDYLNNFVVYNMLDGNVTNFYGEEIPLSAIIYTAYQRYCDEKSKADNSIEESHGSTNVRL